MGSIKYKRAIIIANGTISNTALTFKRLTDYFGLGIDDIIISADGGGFNTLEMGLVPDVVIGDMDSLNQSLKKKDKENIFKNQFHHSFC